MLRFFAMLLLVFAIRADDDKLYRVGNGVTPPKVLSTYQTRAPRLMVTKPVLARLSVSVTV